MRYVEVCRKCREQFPQPPFGFTLHTWKPSVASRCVARAYSGSSSIVFPRLNFFPSCTQHTQISALKLMQTWSFPARQLEHWQVCRHQVPAGCSHLVEAALEQGEQDACGEGPLKFVTRCHAGHKGECHARTKRRRHPARAILSSHIQSDPQKMTTDDSQWLKARLASA